MTFILGIMSLLTLNTFFVSIGGGYRKLPATVQSCVKDYVKEVHENVNLPEG